MLVHLFHLVRKTVRASVSGSAVKHVQCARCGCRFVYRLHRTATGQSAGIRLFGEERAKSDALTKAQRALPRVLDRAVEPMPCPDCETYRPDMVRALRWRRCKPLAYVVLVSVGSAPKLL
jgi:hypothetical protein